MIKKYAILRYIMIFTILSIIIIFMAVFIRTKAVVYAAGNSHMFDDQGVLGESDVSRLEAALIEVTQTTGLYTMAVITDNIPIENKKNDAALIDYVDLYLEKYAGKNTDGVLYMIINDEQTNYYSWISTQGRAIQVFTDADINRISNQLGTYENNADYQQAVEQFIQYVKEENAQYLKDIANSAIAADKQSFYNIFIFTFIGACIGLFIWLIVFLGLKLQRTMWASKNATGYLDHSSINFVGRRDRYIRTDVSKVHINSDSSGGGSSTHISSGGGTHGGGGRHR